MENKREIVAKNIENLLKNREEFYKFLDQKVEKIDGTSMLDFRGDETLKGLYERFFAYDYEIRKLLPYLYEAYEVKFNV